VLQAFTDRSPGAGLAASNTATSTLSLKEAGCALSVFIGGLQNGTTEIAKNYMAADQRR
jgi:hypothetical protein